MMNRAEGIGDDDELVHTKKACACCCCCCCPPELWWLGLHCSSPLVLDDMDLVGLHSTIIYLLCRGLGPVGMRRFSSSSSAHAPPPAAAAPLSDCRPPLLHRVAAPAAASKRTDAPTPTSAATAWRTVVVAPVNGGGSPLPLCVRGRAWAWAWACACPSPCARLGGGNNDGADLPSATAASCSTTAMASHDSAVAARAHRRRLIRLARSLSPRASRRHGRTRSLGLAGGYTHTGPRLGLV